jgi:hypothetical protein
LATPYKNSECKGYREIGKLDERTILIISFGLGIALQVAILLHGDWSWFKLLICAAIGLVGLIPGKHEHVYQPLFHILMWFSFFSISFAFMFSKEILPIISEPVLLSYTLVFWFALFIYYSDHTSLQSALFFLPLIPSAACLYLSFRRTQLGFVFKLILYTWFLVIIVSLGLFQFPFGQLALFYDERQVPWVSPIESAMAGMAFLFLLVNGTYVFYLIPIPGRTQSWTDRMKDWHEFTDLLTQRVADSQITRVQTSIILAVEGTALALNAIYDWLPPGLVINLAIIIPSLVFHPKLLPAMSPSSPQDGGSKVPHSRPLLKGKFRSTRR